MKLSLYTDEKEFPNKELDTFTLKLTGKEFSEIKFGYIPSSSDKHRKYFNETKRYWSNYGLFNFVYVDLDEEYNDADVLNLKNCDLIYLSGGKTKSFLANIYKRKFNLFLEEFINNNKLVIGVSAGAILLTPSIEYTCLYDEPTGIQNSKLLNSLKGLSLVKFEFIPHYDIIGKDENLKEYINNKAKYNIYTSGKGSGICINDQDILTFGNIQNFQQLTLPNGILH